jgi:hypothetical protein
MSAARSAVLTTCGVVSNTVTSSSSSSTSSASAGGRAGLAGVVVGLGLPGHAGVGVDERGGVVQGGDLGQQRLLAGRVHGQAGVLDRLVHGLVELGQRGAHLAVGGAGLAQRLGLLGGQRDPGQPAVGVDLAGRAVADLGQAEPDQEPLGGEPPVDAAGAADAVALDGHAALPQPGGHERGGQAEHRFGQAARVHGGQHGGQAGQGPHGDAVDAGGEVLAHVAAGAYGGGDDRDLDEREQQ